LALTTVIFRAAGLWRAGGAEAGWPNPRHARDGEPQLTVSHRRGHRRRQLAPKAMEPDEPPSPAGTMVSALLTQVLTLRWWLPGGAVYGAIFGQRGGVRASSACSRGVLQFRDCGYVADPSTVKKSEPRQKKQGRVRSKLMGPISRFLALA
jgi:hypothetical protein